MGLSVERNGYIDNVKMWADIARDLTAHGFNVVNGPIADDTALIVLEASNAVDPIADQQPWRLLIRTDADSTKLNAATPDQIQDDGTIALLSNSASFLEEAGQIGRIRSAAGNTSPMNFYNRGTAAVQSTLEYKKSTKAGDNYNYASHVDDNTFSLADADYAATPFSYQVCIGSHGVLVCTWVEGMDGAGCKFNWFCIQRPINKDGSVVTTGKAPLFCIWSDNGGGAPDANELDYGGIMRFTVREADVNAPTVSVSAIQHTPDAYAIMNPLQQVAFSEDGKYDLRFPQGLNSHRYSYPYEADMVAYTSADVISHYTSQTLNMFGEPQDRTYKALNANSKNNKGMRLLVLVDGAGVTPE